MFKKRIFILLLFINCVSYGAEHDIKENTKLPQPLQKNILFEPFFLATIGDLDEMLRDTMVTLQHENDLRCSALQETFAQKIAQLEINQDEQFTILKSNQQEIYRQQQDQLRCDQTHLALMQKLGQLSAASSTGSPRKRKDRNQTLPLPPAIEAFESFLEVSFDAILIAFIHAHEAKDITSKALLKLPITFDQQYKTGHTHMLLLLASKSIEHFEQRRELHSLERAEKLNAAIRERIKEIPNLLNDPQFNRLYTTFHAALETQRSMQRHQSEHQTSSEPPLKKLKGSDQ